MKLAIFGATGNTGRATVANALAAALDHSARLLRDGPVRSMMMFRPTTTSSIVPRRKHVPNAFVLTTTTAMPSNRNFSALQRPHRRDLSSTVRREDESESDVGHVQVETLSDEQEGIAVVSLHRPAAKNALNRSMTSRLSVVFHGLTRDAQVRVVIVRSRVANVFCAGADLKERSGLAESEVIHVVGAIRNAVTRFADLPMPTIAALDGIALGGGLELALAADIRIISSTAKMGLVETGLGIIPGGGGTQRLPRLVGTSTAKELMYTGRVFGGDEAGRLGIANHVVEQNGDGDAAYRRALDLAREIAAKGPIANRMVKRAVDRGVDTDLASGFVIENDCYAEIVPTKDRLEGLAAFREKRSPNFQGN